ncbi:MAG: T9SS type A sorting domain-containing protein [Chitinivibrionia bacterium]|nr:T9SS type A sorting domain-containing protein [Chitinivibrionia bacterium]
MCKTLSSFKTFRRGGAFAIVFAAASLSFAQTVHTNYAFPSPMPPTGDLNGVKQIVSFIWDDNAYSGKKGTNYEGPSTKAGTFTTQNYVGGYREEGGWATTGNNELNIQEGDFGMSWAINGLSGRNIIPYPDWNPNSDVLKSRPVGAQTYSPNLAGGYSDTVVYNEVIYACVDWVGTGENDIPPDQTIPDRMKPLWSVVRPVGSRTFKQNPDGSPITMTFNVITGLIVTAYPIDWQSRESKFGYYVPNDEFYKVGESHNNRHSKISVTWGREYAIFNDKAADDTRDVSKQFYFGYIEESFRETIKLGHEVGNHTIDHMETNSPLPNKAGQPIPSLAGAGGTAYRDGFDLWGGEGYDDSKIDEVTLPSGAKLTVDEGVEYTQRDGNIWQYMGWKANSGKVLSTRAWEGLIKLAEEELTYAYNISNKTGEVVAFRAPRLEVNSSLFWGLKNQGYLYDCGNEEGYEYNMNGTNYLWPYTMDNGSPNVAWQRMSGEDKSNFDSLPQGLWQYPVSVLIIPQGYREEIFKRHATIMRAEGESPTAEDSLHFVKIGKVTGFDFNLFILYGASKEAGIATMRYALDKRMAGGKAPMQIGCHTDYFTPIYDYATLLNEANKDAYGLVVSNKWNDWKDRIAVFEDIRDYGLQKGAYFLDGRKAIEYVKTLVAAARKGATEKTLTSIGSWEFFTHNSKSSVENGNIASGATINTQSAEWETAGYGVYGDAGEFEFDHISLSYLTSAPLTIRLLVDGNAVDEEYPYEVTLNNLNGWDESVVEKIRYRESGDIPLSAFQRNQYIGDKYPDLVGLQAPGTDFARTITGIEVAVQVPSGKAQKTYLSVKDFTLFSGEQTQGIKTGIAQKTQKANVIKTAVLGMTSNALKLNLSNTGVYNVDIITANGRVVKSFKSVNLNAGLNTLSLNGLAKGMYMVRIHNKNFNTSLKSLVL